MPALNSLSVGIDALVDREVIDFSRYFLSIRLYGEAGWISTPRYPWPVPSTNFHVSPKHRVVPVLVAVMLRRSLIERLARAGLVLQQHASEQWTPVLAVASDEHDGYIVLSVLQYSAGQTTRDVLFLSTGAGKAHLMKLFGDHAKSEVIVRPDCTRRLIRSGLVSGQPKLRLREAHAEHQLVTRLEHHL